MSMRTAGGLAERGDVPLGPACPIDRAMGLLGNRTAMLLLREAFYGATRFEQLVRRVGVTEAVAAQRLRELVAAGVLEKQPYREPGQRTRHEYVLTASGEALAPVLIGLLEWGRTYLPDERSRLTLTHADCDAPVHAVLRCEAGHDVAASEVVVEGRRLRASD
ncbi:MAG TPA: helix-turn-helix domain-containing protein [Nocardioides sp.]|nr:helix-turn-helix domain-containing protein [Nocardioides sp.]